VFSAGAVTSEQAEGHSLDERSDVFSFGAVLYEMISGERAFAGGSTAQVLSAVLRDDPPPLPASAALEQLVRRCLAKQPGHRFQTMAAVRAALEQLVSEPAEPQPSIAVLPFANMSGDKDNEYFSDGLAEEIINAMAQVPGLNVTARTSSFAFRGKEQDIRKIAELLGVRTILEGSVRRAGNRVRVTAQLINAANGYHLWSDRYDRELADVFAIQDEIAQAIAAALQVKLSPQPAHHQPSLPAYEALLRGRHLVGKFTPESLARGKEFLEQAVALDPKLALAHVELGNYAVRLVALGVSPARQVLPLARAAAYRALEVDSGLPEAHALLGQVASVLDHDWQQAGRHFRSALARDPVPPHVRYCHGWTYLMPLGRLPQAAGALERALKEDPLNLICRTQLGVLLWALGRDEDASSQFRQVLEIDGDFWLALMVQSVRQLFAGRLTEALRLAERSYSVAPSMPSAIGTFAATLHQTGETERAKAVLEKLGDGRAHGSAMGFAAFYQGCLELDKAAEWVAQAIDERDPNTFPIMCGPGRRLWESSGHWQSLARMMNLPESATSQSA
jgi:serine/threonine-protein kinase